MLLRISISVLAFVLSVAADNQQTAIIPALWCLDASTAEECDVLPQCQAYNTTMRNQKFNLTLVYWVHCGPCNYFINETIYHEIWKEFRDYVNLDLWPFDGAQSYNAKAHSCVIYYLEDIARWFPFVHCLSEQFIIRGGEHFNESLATCFDRRRVKKSEQQKILACAGGLMGVKLQQEFAAKGNSLKPDKPFMFPWIVLNGISSLKAQLYEEALLMALCSWYSGDETPEACKWESYYRYFGIDEDTTQRRSAGRCWDLSYSGKNRRG